MFGCLGRLGCLIVLVLAAAVGWFTQDSWLPRVKARLMSVPPATTSTAKWEPLTAAGADRARAAVAKLSLKNGPVYVNIAAGDLAAFVLDSVLHGFSPTATNAEAMARDDHLYLRAQVSVADLGGPKTLGPLSGMLEGKQELSLRGRLEVLKPGRAQFRVDQVALKELKLPAAMIAQLVGRIGIRGRDSSVAGDAIPVRVPAELADVRVGKGRVTLYKAVP
jgi:hypothetical protein